MVQRDPRGRRLAARGLWSGAEMIVTLGVVLLLLVVHQLWWTNRQARADARHKVQSLEQEWGRPGGADDGVPSAPSDEGASTDADTDAAGEGGDAPTGGARTAAAAAPRWDQAYAVIRIPRLGLTAPVAQGIGKSGVLGKGYVGHYPRTAQPGGAGNFALAGHRNTHGEPFRHINRLRRGDRITVETRARLYTYVVDKTLAQTAARHSGVIAAVPRSNLNPAFGYSEPGSYVTLTTCTPEFTSRYRLVVWGKLAGVQER
ncbi:class E sortase [Streptomyces sp. 900116325]